jgi:hypothetical protein
MSSNLDFRQLHGRANDDRPDDSYQYQPRSGIVEDFIGNYQQTFDQLELELTNKDNEIQKLNQLIYDMNNGEPYSE